MYYVPTKICLRESKPVLTKVNKKIFITRNMKIYKVIKNQCHGTDLFLKDIYHIEQLSYCITTVQVRKHIYVFILKQLKS